MIISVLLATVLAGQTAPLPAHTNAAPAARGQRAFVFTLQPQQRRVPVTTGKVRPDAEEREIICGMVVVRKTPAADPKILLPRRDTGAVIRRGEPKACTARLPVPAK